MKNNFLEIAISSAEKSGKILQEYFEKVHDARSKNENIRDLITEVDLISENEIKKIIKSKFPEHSIVGEEGGKDIKKSDYCWHIDPIDGTVNYSQGIPLCAVSIALEFKQRIILGVIYNPFFNELYYATENQGAFLNGKKIQVSKKDQLKNGLYISAFSSEIDKEKKYEYNIFGHFNNNSLGALRIGSAALSLAYLSCGKIDGFWTRGLNSWDIAAGLCILKESGGKYSDEEGNPFKYKNFLIASNSILHEQLLLEINTLKK